MSRFGLLTQIGMILIAVAIGFFYIKPAVIKIRETEDSIAVYQHEVDNVSAVNADLTAKIATVDAVPSGDSQALLRYMPDSVDEIAVMKDVLAILNQFGVSSPDVLAKKMSAPAAPAEGEMAPLASVVPYDFEVKFKTTYPKLLETLSAIEVNDYLLQVSSLKVTPDTTSGLDVTMTLTAYALAPAHEPESEVIEE